MENGTNLTQEFLNEILGGKIKESSNSNTYDNILDLTDESVKDSSIIFPLLKYKDNAYNPIYYRVAWVKNDLGKNMKIKYISRGKEGISVLKAISMFFSKINWMIFDYKQNPNNYTKEQVEWLKKMANSKSYNKICKNGLSKNDKAYKYSQGWLGNEYIAFNSVDTNLDKVIIPACDRQEFDIEGKTITSYTYGLPVYNLKKYFKENGIKFFERGNGLLVKKNCLLTESGNQYINYTISQSMKLKQNQIQKVMALQPINLCKLIKPTKAQVIYDRLRTTISEIDAELGTNFMSILISQVNSEENNIPIQETTEKQEVKTEEVKAENKVEQNTKDNDGDAWYEEFLGGSTDKKEETTDNKNDEEEFPF